jgi:hypothetical protein
VQLRHPDRPRRVVQLRGLALGLVVMTPLYIASEYARHGRVPSWALWAAYIDRGAILLWIVVESMVRWRRNRFISFRGQPRLPR